MEGLGVPIPTGMIAKLKELLKQRDEQRLGKRKTSEYGPMYSRFKDLMRQVGVDTSDHRDFRVYADCFHG